MIPLLLLLIGLPPGDSAISLVSPSEYTLCFTLYPASQHYTGNTDIFFQLLEDTATLTIHSKGLEVLRLLLYLGRGRSVFPVEFASDGEDELAITRTDGGTFQADEYFIRIQFRAPLKRELSGIYLTDYTDEDGTTHPIVATHFEPTHARKAFPCFDEPHLKAKFTIMVDHEVIYSVISNMPKKKDRSVRSNFIRTEFVSTPMMSTYLVAFVLSDLREMSVVTNRGVLVRSFYRPEKEDMVLNSLETVKESIEFFERYLGRVFPLPKLDVVPLPDFGIGGMENWGLITIREDLFYTGPDTAPDTIILMRAVLAHEVAHMWFGDLVSISSWNDLWLKEGAAQMLMYPAIEELVTKGTNQTVSDINSALIRFSQFPALEQDASLNTHPVSMNISDANEAASAFDAISYSKSAALLNMLKSLIGEEEFREGVSKYVKEYQYTSASLTDFLSVMDTTGSVYRKLPVSEFMESWLTMSGYPVIDIKQRTSRSFRLQQTRFVSQPNYKDKRGARSKWPVMITLTTQKGKVHKFLMNTRTKVVSFNYDPGFVKLNINATMFFRTNYDESTIRGIIEQLEKNHEQYFTAEDRMGIVSDVLAMARVNKCPMSHALRVLRYLPKEGSSSAWGEALPQLHKISENLSNATLLLFNKYMRKLLKEGLTQELNEDSVNDILLQSSLSYYGVLYNVPSAAKAAKKEFQLWEEDNSQDISTVVLMYGVVTLGKAALIWDKLVTTPYPENSLFYNSLSASEDTELIGRLLQGSLDSEWMPMQNRYDVVNMVSYYHPRIALTFLKENYKTYYSMYADTQFNFGNILHTVVGNLKTREDLEDAQGFFKTVDLGSGERAYRLAVDEVTSMLDWRTCCEDEMRLYLAGDSS